jgi:hypothetical protein
MDRSLAEELMAGAMLFVHPIGELDKVISNIVDPELKQSYIKALGDILGILSASFIFPISEEYPDLSPNKTAR